MLRNGILHKSRKHHGLTFDVRCLKMNGAEQVSTLGKPEPVQVTVR